MRDTKIVLALNLKGTLTNIASVMACIINSWNLEKMSIYLKTESIAWWLYGNCDSTAY